MGKGRTDEMNSPEFDADGNLMEFPVVDNLMMRHGLNISSEIHFSDEKDAIPFGRFPKKKQVSNKPLAPSAVASSPKKI